MDTNAVIDGDGTVVVEVSHPPRNEVETIAAAEDEHHESQSFVTFPFLSLRLPVPSPVPFPSSPVPVPAATTTAAAHTTNKKASRKTKTKTVVKTRPTTIKIRRTVFTDRRSKHGRFIRNTARVSRTSTSKTPSSSATAAARRPSKASDEVFHTANQKSMGLVGSSERAFASAVECLEEESDGGDIGDGATEVDRRLEPPSNLNTNPTASSFLRGASSALKREKYNSSTIHDNADDDEKEFHRKRNELNNTRIRDPSDTGANKKDDDKNGCRTVATSNILLLTEPKHNKKRRYDHHKQNETIHPSIQTTTSTTPTPTMETFFTSGHKGIAYSFINYLENDEKIQLACTCSSMNKHVLNGKGIEVPVDPLIVVSPSKRNHDDSHRGERFLRNMLAHHQDERKKTILHNHYRVKIENVHQFGFNFCNQVTVAETLAEMRSITELDISLPTPAHIEATQFVGRLIMMFPNLRKINLTNISFAPGLLADEYCPRLETIIWKNTTPDPGDFVWSRDFASFRHLKEITLDNRSFFFDMADTTSNDIFLFQQCASNNPMLARVSMKHAIDTSNKPVAQSVLMQIVRNVPSLTYFRSDLTPENIAILQLERPAMVFE